MLWCSRQEGEKVLSIFLEYLPDVPWDISGYLDRRMFSNIRLRNTTKIS